MYPSSGSGPVHALLCLCLTVSFSSACALLVPPSWRSDFDIGLFGPIDGRKRAPESETAESAAQLDPDERRLRATQLAEAVERDRRELIDLVADPGASERSPADDPELRRIVERLPELQQELQSLERAQANQAEGRPAQGNHAPPHDGAR